MWIRRIAFVAVGLVVLGSSARARSARLTGAVASVTPSSLQVLTKSEGTKSVALDPTTQYLKWVLHKPWQDGEAVSFTSLNIGRCVEVDVRAAAATEAKTVWVSTEPAGSLYDPCKDVRK